MVFFTCNHCGGSVKKPAVEKHYNFQCRGVRKSVSCMDCQQDFHDEEYVAHTRCITEAEKYSSKDFVAKEPKNSGQKKQEGWMEIIRSILDTKEYRLSKDARKAFETLQSVDNVPRKKAKFQNFATNCIRMRKDKVEEVWNVLEKELEKMKASAKQANGIPKGAENLENTKPETDAVAEQRATNEAEEQPEKKRVKKSKKRKVDKEIQNTIEQDEEKDILQMITEMSGNDEANGEPSKKKSKKSKVNEANGEPAKKKHKKSKDSVAKQDEVNAEQEPTISTTTPDEFQWSPVMICTLRKYGESMKLEKLKKKVLRMYLSKKEATELTEKQQKKFDKKFVKYLKKCNFKIENNVVSLSPQTVSDN